MCRLTLVLVTTLVLSGAAHAQTFAAAEQRLATTSPTAAFRSGKSDELRLLVWRPAAAGTVETPRFVGPPDHPAFLAGWAAPADAPWPAGPQRYPVVVLSHGNGGAGVQMAWLGQALADAGFVAVALDHPGNNGAEPMTLEGAALIWERAEDLKLALTAVLADPVMGPRIDGARAGVAGFSIGGWSAALAVGAVPDIPGFVAFCEATPEEGVCQPQKEQAVKVGERFAAMQTPAYAPYASGMSASHADPRFKAAFLIAPALGRAVTPASLKAIKVPVAIVVGSGDVIAGEANNAAVFKAGVPKATLKVLPKVTHYDFLNPCGREAAAQMGAYCVSEADRSAVHKETAADAVAFFRKTLATTR